MAESTTPSVRARSAQLSPWLACLIAVTVLLAKMPDVLLHGRYWAEEASIFGTDLIGRSPWAALTYIYKGTHVILTSATVWLGFLFPIAWAPFVTTWLATLALLVVVAQYTLWCKRVGINVLTSLTGLIAILFLVCLPEVIATATNLQWVCSVSCLFLLLTKEDDLKRWLLPTSVWVVLCGLTGAPPCMLAPFLIARSLVERSRAHLLIGALLLCCALVQAYTIHAGDPGGRTYGLNPLWAVVSFFQQTVLVNVLPMNTVYALGWRISENTPKAPFATALVILFGVTLGLYSLFASSAYSLRDRVLLLLGPWVLVTFLNMFGALNNTFPLAIIPPMASRYYVVGTFCFLLLLISSTAASRRWQRYSSLVLVTWIAILGMVRAAYGWPDYYLHGPSWRAEVAKCQRSTAPACDLAVWPRTTPQVWAFHLTRRDIAAR